MSTTEVTEKPQDKVAEYSSRRDDQVVSGIEDRESVPGKQRTAKKKTFAQKIAKEAMMLVRRIHLFSGLFMFPWVLLYGFTGWFFNHPTYFSGDEVRSFNAAVHGDSGLAQLPDPTQLAGRVVEEINLESFVVDGPEVELTDTLSPQFDRYLSFNVNAGDQTHRIEIHPVTGSGVVRTTAVPPDDESKAEVTPSTNPLAVVNSVNLPENSQTIAQAAVPELLSSLGLSSGEAFAGRATANLKFSALVDGRPCAVSYNLGSGAITAVADDAPGSSMSAKAFAQRLHLARGYAPALGVRTWWAISVDAMFFSMVFWGMSGIFMWWQIKRTRKLGLAILVASALCAGYLVIGMHAELGPRERGRGGRQSAALQTPTDAGKGTSDANVTDSDNSDLVQSNSSPLP